MATVKKRKRILFIALIILIALFLRVHMVRKFPKQIQGLIKYKVSSDVVKKQDELYEAVVEKNNPERGYVVFPSINYLQIHPKRTYGCGFYYSEEDMPIDTYTGHYVDSDTAVYETWPFYFHYWYRTEKITDNWWYYERWTMTMPTPHDSIIGNIIEGIIDEIFPPKFSE